MEIEIRIPSFGESITEVTLSKWLKKDGDLVKMDESICELESEKATNELPAEKAGRLSIIASEGSVLKIGDLLAKIDVSIAVAALSEVTANKELKLEIPDSKSQITSIASPAAEKLIRETGATVGNGTGKDGRITKGDVLKAFSVPVNKITVNSDAHFSRNERREKMSALRKTVSKHLVAAKNTTAMLTTFNEVDMKAIIDIRNKYKDAFKEKYGIGLGFMSFFAKACCIALKEFPSVNGFIDGDEIVFHDYCDVSIAVSTPKGLVVPVIRNTESLSFVRIEEKVAQLAKRGRENKLTLEEMTGGTFTITNGGVFGSLMSTPIINFPQAAILGMHKIQERPVALDGLVVIRPMMYVALSYDHRIIDGKESVSFLVRVKELLEHPEQLLMGHDPVKEMLML